MSRDVMGSESSGIIERRALGLKRIGRYELCFEIAAGGMATVYLARLEGMGGFSKLVALKCIHPHLVRQESFVEMFLDEARLASRIEHPNVCGIFDFGFAEETYYIAMEFLVGETVSRLFKLASQHPHLSPHPAHAFFAARLVADAAAGLHAAHELTDDDGRFLNVVHRDVSPQNLMVTYDGVTKIMDFGIASAVDQLHVTRTGTVRGKFAYMSPEQLEGRTVDRRADVWSLGVILWELLTGNRLFGAAGEVDAMRAVLDAPIVTPSSVRAGIARELDGIVLRCLSRDPGARYGSAQELAAQLNGLAPRRGVSVTPSALGEWLKTLFPDLHARRLELLDQARQMRSDGVPRVSPMLSQAEMGTLRMTESPSEHPKGHRRARAIAALASVAALGGGVALGVGMAEKEPDAGVSKPAARAKDEPLMRPEPARKEELAPAPSREARVAASNELPAASSTASKRAPSKRAPPRAQAKNRSQRAPANPPPGWVDVATPGGWADVYVSGRLRGRTPLRLSLPAGRQVIGLRPFGKGKVRYRAVTIRSGELEKSIVPVSAPDPG